MGKPINTGTSLNRGRSLALLAAVAAMGLGSWAKAADATWSGTTETWSTNTNWSPTVTWDTWNRSSTASFAGAGTKTIRVDLPGLTVGSLSFSGANYTILSKADKTSESLTLNNPVGSVVDVAGSITADIGLGLIGDFDKTGAGTLKLSNTENGGNGFLNVNVQQGKLLSGGTNAFTTTGANIVVAAGAILDGGGYNNNLGDLMVNGAAVGSGKFTIGVGKSVYLNETSSTSSISGGSLDLTNGKAFSVEVGSRLTVSSVVTGTGVVLTVNKVGKANATTGTLKLSAVNNYTGTTAVAAGTLLVDGSLASGNAVAVESSATLGGTNGLVSGTVRVNSGATIAPGDGTSVSKLTTGSETWEAGGHYAVDVKGLPTGTPGENNDLLVVNGTVTTPGPGTFNIDFTKTDTLGLNTPGGFQGRTPNTVYNWVIATVTSGGFNLSSLTLNTPTFGIKGTDYLGDFSLKTFSGGNQLAVHYEYAAVPEAATLLLGGVAMIPLLMQRRRTGVRGEELGQS